MMLFRSMCLGTSGAHRWIGLRDWVPELSRIQRGTGRQAGHAYVASTVSRFTYGARSRLWWVLLTELGSGALPAWVWDSALAVARGARGAPDLSPPLERTP